MKSIKNLLWQCWGRRDTSEEDTVQAYTQSMKPEDCKEQVEECSKLIEQNAMDKSCFRKGYEMVFAQ